jgi:hypothetical protein
MPFVILFDKVSVIFSKSYKQTFNIEVSATLKGAVRFQFVGHDQAQSDNSTEVGTVMQAGGCRISVSHCHRIFGPVVPLGVRCLFTRVIAD